MDLSDLQQTILLEEALEALHRDLQFIARHARDYPRALFKRLVVEGFLDHSRQGDKQTIAFAVVRRSVHDGQSFWFEIGQRPENAFGLPGVRHVASLRPRRRSGRLVRYLSRLLVSPALYSASAPSSRRVTSFSNALRFQATKASAPSVQTFSATDFLAGLLFSGPNQATSDSAGGA